MRSRKFGLAKTTWVLCLVLLVGCLDSATPETATSLPPLPTGTVAAELDFSVDDGRDFIVVATDAPNPPLTDFDAFGNVIGLHSAVMEAIADVAGFEYEIVVTPYEGVLANIAMGSSGDFDVVMPTVPIPETWPEGIVFTDPFLEVGQVLVVLADEDVIQTFQDIPSGTAVGVLANSRAAETARKLPGITETDIYDSYARPVQVIQALIDEAVEAVIIDSYSAGFFVEAFPEQLKTPGGVGREAWLNSTEYGLALAADNVDLLARLNEAVARLQRDQVIDQLAVSWLVNTNARATIEPGESRVGTRPNELVIGLAGLLSNTDPAGLPSLPPDFIDWEVKANIMSGLYRLNSENVLEPLLATGLPEISEDGLEYTVRLRDGLLFPDGTNFDAEDVQWSVLRSARLGNFLVNDYLKDENEDNFADADAVQIVDQSRVKFVLQEPVAYFLSLLATPPYFPISSQCFAEGSDPNSLCGGIGPYTIENWKLNDRMRLQANPQWPGQPPPAFDHILLRFYDSPEAMRRSLEEFQSIDMAWTGLPFADFVALRESDSNDDDRHDFIAWEGPAVFKSYLIFEHKTPPWDRKNIRQAVALAVDREVLATDVFEGGRRPLYSPVPDDVPGHLPVLPRRDLDRARTLLSLEGYGSDNPLEITIWYLNDGRYTPLEAEYANAIKVQLEETGIFDVTLFGAPWENDYQIQISQCAYPAYLLGWPSPGRPTNYLDLTSWTDFFVQSTDSVFCSNYESEQMTRLVDEASQALDLETRAALNEQIQRLWAEDLPTLDLTQEPRRAITLDNVSDVHIDALGLLHYELLTKN